MRQWYFGAILFLLCAGMAAPSAAADQFRPSDGGGTSRPSATRTGIYRGHAVTYAIINGKPIFEGDIILDHVQDLVPGQPLPNKAAPASVGIAYAQYFWPKDSLGRCGKFPTSVPRALRISARPSSNSTRLSPALSSSFRRPRRPITLTSISTQPITAPRAIPSSAVPAVNK